MTLLKSPVWFFMVILSTVQFTSESHDALLTKVARSKLMSIVKRNIDCPSDEYFTSSHCCKLCPKGKYKKSDCVEAHGKADCVSCTRGKDYMDHENHLPKCERCRACDVGQGLEVQENCTDDQNTKCQCMKDYYNSSTVNYNEHCYPCEICKHGVERECTSNQNTVCKAKDYMGLIALLVIPIVLGIIAFIYKMKRKTRDEAARTGVNKKPEEEELLPEDVDLQSCLPEISEKFMKKHMLQFVRKTGIKEPEIDAILNNNPNNEEEQKFKLLESWYQRHGKKGAYQELIRELKKLNLNALVDDIKKTVSVSNALENVQSSSIQLEDRNESEVQSVEEEMRNPESEDTE